MHRFDQSKKIVTGAVALGLSAIIGSLLIGVSVLQVASLEIENQIKETYLNRASALARLSENLVSDSLLMHEIVHTWESQASRPEDEYVCIVDSHSNLILHTAAPQTVGNYAGDNELVNANLQTHPDLKSIVALQEGYVGGYISSAGEKQLAAFSPIKERGWVLGVHRSEATVRRHISNLLKPQFIGIMGISLGLIPLAFGLLVFIFLRLDREQYQIRNALIESESRFKDIAESMSNWIWEIDQNDRYIFSSGSGESMLGYTHEEIIGKTPFDFMPPTEAVSIRSTFSKIVEERRSFRHLENWNLTKDGRKIRLLTSGVPIIGSQGEYLGYRGVDTDITESYNANLILQERELLVRESQEVARIGSYVLDIPTGVWVSSVMLMKIFEIDEEYTRDIEGWLKLVHPKDKDMMNQYFALNVLTNHEVFNKEYRIQKHKSGEECWVHGMGRLEFNQEGQPIIMR